MRVDNFKLMSQINENDVKGKCEQFQRFQISGYKEWIIVSLCIAITLPLVSVHWMGNRLVRSVAVQMSEMRFNFCKISICKLRAKCEMYWMCTPFTWIYPDGFLFLCKKKPLSPIIIILCDQEFFFFSLLTGII